jgi:hypothetical protein
MLRTSSASGSRLAADGSFAGRTRKRRDLIFDACRHRDALTGLPLLSQRDEHLGRP